MRFVSRKCRQGCRDICRSLKPRIRVFGHHSLDDGSKFVRNVVPVFSQGRRSLFHVSLKLVHDRIGSERRLSGEQITERAAQTVDVRADIGRMCIAGLFRCNVVRCPHHAAECRQVQRCGVAFG